MCKGSEVRHPHQVGTKASMTGAQRGTIDEAKEGARGHPPEKSFLAMQGILALFLAQQEATEGFKQGQERLMSKGAHGGCRVEDREVGSKNGSGERS